MSTTSFEPAVVESIETQRVSIQGPLCSLLLWFMPGTLGIFLLWGAIPTVLMPLQVEQLDPVNKVANLAIVTTIGAVVAMVMQPVAGTINERTRSRFGSRAPYIVGGALFGGLAQRRDSRLTARRQRPRCLPHSRGHLGRAPHALRRVHEAAR